MLTGENFVARLHDQIVTLLVEAIARKVSVRRPFLQNRIGGNHFSGYQVLPYAEVLERALGLCAPEPVGWNIYLTQTVSFLTDFCHFCFSFLLELHLGSESDNHV